MLILYRVIAAMFVVAPGQTSSGPAGTIKPDWWSFKPLSQPKIPVVKNKLWVKSPIDAFVLKELEKHNLNPAPPADKPTLIRRATYDLIGLPPTPEEIRAFVSDTSPNSFEKLIDRLLASPHYGERWGRHWLDVARFSESHGYEYDRLRPNAWRYRDYVIESLNSDIPYNQFLKEQVAGDLLDSSEHGVIATGFLVSGPHDEAAFVSSSPLVKSRARQEEMEEMVGLVGQSALGLTVNCARCHDHKFDPIPQRDYYRMKAALDGVLPGDRDLISSANRTKNAETSRQLKNAIANLQSRIQSVYNEASLRLSKNSLKERKPIGPHPIYQWNFADWQPDSKPLLNVTLKGSAKIQNAALSLDGNGSYAITLPTNTPIAAKTLEAWVSIDDLNQRGGSILTLESDEGKQFDGIVYGEQEPTHWMAGSEFFHRTRPVGGPPENAKPEEIVHIAITYSMAGSVTVYRNGMQYGQTYNIPGADGKLVTYPPNISRILIGLRHTGSTGYFKGKIYGAKIYSYALNSVEIKNSFTAGYDVVSPTEIEAAMSPDEKGLYLNLKGELKLLSESLSKLETPQLTYSAISSKPEVTHILARGDQSQPREAVSSGGIEAIRTLPADLKVSPEAGDPERRLRFAEWLTDDRNPLPARVMANRIWMYHFGNGIVNTPNDFGFNGDKPSHPELLDWLSTRFQSGTNGSTPWSIKSLHKLIMLSNTYRQSSTFNAEAAKLDSEDRLLWRFAPHRLEGEAIRDSMLSISGKLNNAIYGPSFQPFDIVTFGSAFYVQKDLDTPEMQRRSIYRINVQSAKSPFLSALDCPDPSTKTPRRSISTTPIQALELMNNSFVDRSCKALANWISQSTSKPSDQILKAFELTLGRYPTATEMADQLKFVADHKLENLCWILFNSTEFLYVR